MNVVFVTEAIPSLQRLRTDLALKPAATILACWLVQQQEDCLQLLQQWVLLLISELFLACCKQHLLATKLHNKKQNEASASLSSKQESTQPASHQREAVAKLLTNR